MRYVSKEKLNKMALFDADGEQVAVVSGDDIEAARADVADCLWLAHGQKVSCPLHGVRKSGLTTIKKMEVEMIKENKKFVGFLLDEKSEAQLRQKAKDEGRTVSGQLRVIIEGQLCPEKQKEEEVTNER